MTADYHTKPVLAVRVPRELQDWARGEAERRGQGVGDFIASLLSAERERCGQPSQHGPHSLLAGSSSRNTPHPWQ